ncbi:MAG TPA: hypothetical protein VK081_13510, partial [Planctomycetota bacterium]|nr:hypothetical protein [Planctomycetota bacterium]
MVPRSLLLGLFTIGVCAQQAVVVPPEAAAVDAATLTDLAGFHRRFVQQVVVRSSLLSGFREFTALAVRRDGQFDRPLTGGRASLQVTLAPALTSPDRVAAVFAANRGPATVVFDGEVVIPDSPALPHRNAATWSSPHAVEIQFSTPFVHAGGDLCIELRGEPVAGAASPWWPIDCALYPHDAQVTPIGQSCDPLLVASASRASLQPGGSAWLFATGAPTSAAVAVLGAEARIPGMSLTPIGAPGCHLYVEPMAMLATTFTA